MSWRGFLTESKSYMNFPGVWPEWNHASVKDGGWTAADKRKTALKFWLAFPHAWVRFHFFVIRDWVRSKFA